MRHAPCGSRRCRSRGAASLLAVAPARAQDAPDLGRLAEFIRWGGVVASSPIILGALFLLRLVENVGDRLSARFSNRRPTIQKVQSTARFFSTSSTFALAVSLSVRLDPTALTVIGGALAFAVGFAMRDLVAAFIAGITIMFDRPFQVGDRVAYGGEYGDIIKIGLRSVRMNTLDHNIITIPNNKVLTDVTSSGNYGALEMQVADGLLHRRRPGREARRRADPRGLPDEPLRLPRRSRSRCSPSR